MKCLLLVLFYHLVLSRVIVSVFAGGADDASSRLGVLFARTTQGEILRLKNVRVKTSLSASGVTVWCREGRVALFVPSIRSGNVFGRDE